MGIPLNIDNAGMMLFTLGVVGFTCIACLVFWTAIRKQPRLPLPPGPPTPKLIGRLIGNVLSVPKECQWFGLTELREQYGAHLFECQTSSNSIYAGKIIHLRAFNRHTIVINGLDEAIDLMQSRGGLYSGREQKVMMHDLFVTANSFYKHRTDT
jgi:hypothetical protein